MTIYHSRDRTAGKETGNKGTERIETVRGQFRKERLVPDRGGKSIGLFLLDLNVTPDRRC